MEKLLITLSIVLCMLVSCEKAEVKKMKANKLHQEGEDQERLLMQLNQQKRKNQVDQEKKQLVKNQKRKNLLEDQEKL